MNNNYFMRYKFKIIHLLVLKLIYKNYLFKVHKLLQELPYFNSSSSFGLVGGGWISVGAQAQQTMFPLHDQVYKPLTLAISFRRET